MPVTKRQKIVDAIIARMQLIRTTNGYETDLGANVADWETNWDEDQLPALSVCDLIETDGSDEFLNIDEDYTVYKMPVQLRIYLKTGERAAFARKIIADVFRAIRVDYGWTLDAEILALRTDYLKDGFIFDEEAVKIGGAAVEIEIFYFTKEFDAYE